jgi:hypothetical protein
MYTYPKLENHPVVPPPPARARARAHTHTHTHTRVSMEISFLHRQQISEIFWGGGVRMEAF